MNTTLAEVASALDHDPFVLIVTEQRCYSGQSKKRKPVNNSSPISSESNGDAVNTCTADVVHLVSGIVSRIDLLDYISSSPQNEATS